MAKNVHILCIDDISEELISRVERLLPERYAKAKRFKHEKGFLHCIGVGVLLLHVFPDLQEEMIQYNVHGKLSVIDYDECSISHSGKYVVLVTDKEPIGIDIEEITEIKEKHTLVSQKVFSPEERQWMQDDLSQRFFVLWTQKEALVKAVGCGITVPLAECNVLPFEKSERVDYAQNRWFGATAIYDNHQVSVCTLSPIDSISFFRVR
ncbi:MAG: 4'-phosphopantetheinyl transferase superfamily protein [Bacteroidales bacterium]|nr:4'-phosphopantetheinyl transferase superfamily protein [Bacteroidales bacterium]